MKKIVVGFLALFVNIIQVSASENWFNQIIDPVLLIDQVKVYYEEKIDYHNYMARTHLELQKKSSKEQSNAFQEMYGIDSFEDNGSLLFKTAYNDHVKWMMQFVKIKNLMKEHSSDSLYLLDQLKKVLDTGVEFYEDTSKGILNVIMTESKKREGRAQGSKFLRNHSLKEAQDFICDFSRFSNSIAQILNYVDLISGKEISIVQILNGNTQKCDYFAIINANEAPIDIISYLHILALIDPENAENEIAFYKEEMNKVYSLVILDDSTALQLENDKNEDSHVGKEKDKSQEESSAETTYDSEQDHKTSDQPSTAELEKVLGHEENKDQEKMDPENKDKGKQKVKWKNKNQPTQQAKQKNISKIPVQQPTMYAQPLISYNVDDLPFSPFFGDDELITLQGILKCQQNIDWKDFEDLITSRKGFNGSICKNKGGSYCVVSFNHPMTQKYVQFLVHKPHKSGKGGAKLYYDLMTRIKHNLEKKGVLNIH